MSNDVSSIHLDSMIYALIGLQAQNKVFRFLQTFYFDCIHSLSLMDLLAPLSPIGRIKILTYLIWGFLGAAIFDCIIRSCDFFLLVHSNLFGSNRRSRRHYVTGTLLCLDHVLFFR